MASDMSKIIDELWDAKSACEMACHDLTPSWERKEADIRWKHAIEAITQYVESLPTPAVGAAGEAVAWAADGTNIYGNFGRVFLTDEKQVEQYASSNYKITPLYAQPSAGAFTDAQCLEVAKAVDNCIRNHLTESQFLIAAVRAALTARTTSEGREDV